MDMQTNVIFEINILNNKREIVRSSSREARLYEAGQLGSDCVNLYEYDQCIVHFFSDDAESFLEIESYKSYDGSPIRIYSEDKAEINPGGSHSNMLVPGIYIYKVLSQCKIFEGMFKIEPTTLSWNGLMNLRDYVDSMAKGLAYNLFCQRSGMNVDGIDHTSSVFEVYRQIEKEFTHIINNLNAITKNPMDKVYKEYKEQLCSTKPDMKSQRWLSQKGLSKNLTPLMPTVVCEKHTALTIDTIENRWIKKIVYTFLNILRSLEYSFDKVYERTTEKIQSKRKEKAKINSRYQGMAGAWQLNERRKELSVSMGYIDREISELTNQLDRIHENVNKLERMKGTLSYYMHESWLKEVLSYHDVKRPTLKLLKDRRYGYLFNLYKDLANIQRREKSSKHTTFSFKKTSELFEYYVLMLVMEILQACDYKWTRGWLAEEENPLSTFTDLTKETVLIFENNYHKIEVAYDIEVKRDDRDYSNSKFFSVNSNHRRPDIRIGVFKKTGEFAGGLIIEVKCCKVSKVYDPKGRDDTKIIEQLKDYYSLRYFDVTAKEDKQLIEHPFHRVIATYPNQPGAKERHHEFFGKILCIPIDPVSPGDVPFGYDTLEQEIRSFLTELQDNKLVI